jgi:hypothetical protein
MPQALATGRRRVGLRPAGRRPCCVSGHKRRRLIPIDVGCSLPAGAGRSIPAPAEPRAAARHRVGGADNAVNRRIEGTSALFAGSTGWLETHVQPTERNGVTSLKRWPRLIVRLAWPVLSSAHDLRGHGQRYFPRGGSVAGDRSPGGGGGDRAVPCRRRRALVRGIAW